ncbi:hypothetical protein DFH06DRAFT_1347960 [Mycena polygramma]|nr:hypothetical protein DFH06DRAFT_1347960 [Mycena polygramma]
MTRQLATDSPHRLVPSARSPCRMQVYPITHSLSVFVRRRSHRTLQFTAVRVSVTTSCPHQGVKPTGATVTVEWPLAAAGESISVLHLNRHGLWCPLQAGPTVKQSGIRFAEAVVRAIGGRRSGSGAVRSPLVLLRPISPPKPETGYGAEEDDLTSQSPESLYESMRSMRKQSGCKSRRRTPQHIFAAGAARSITASLNSSAILKTWAPSYSRCIPVWPLRGEGGAGYPAVGLRCGTNGRGRGGARREDVLHG